MQFLNSLLQHGYSCCARLFLTSNEIHKLGTVGLHLLLASYFLSGGMLHHGLLVEILLLVKELADVGLHIRLALRPLLPFRCKILRLRYHLCLQHTEG